MLFYAVAAAVLCGVSVIPPALAAIAITGPSPSLYWVQNLSNLISWSGYSAGDPNPITITVTNPNNTDLNGVFSIAENVDLSKGSFTVTNVTLRPATGYIVNFVSPRNLSVVIAQSQPFDVKPPGTAQAAGATPTSSSPSATATSPSGSGSGSGGGNGTSTGTAGRSSGTSASSKSNGAVRGVYTAGGPMLGAGLGLGLVVVGGLGLL